MLGFTAFSRNLLDRSSPNIIKSLPPGKRLLRQLALFTTSQFWHPGVITLPALPMGSYSDQQVRNKRRGASMVTVVVLLAIVLVVLVYFIGVYNSLVALREQVKRAWANIDVLLKQRHDELPKLIETCKQYMQYEQATLEKVITARSAVFQARDSGNLGALGQAEQQLRAGLGQLFALVENYPQLKADESFRQLQTRITDLENGIADRRELYNEQVQINNTRIDQFPSSLIARRYGFGAKTMLEFAAAEKSDVDVGTLFKR